MKIYSQAHRQPARPDPLDISGSLRRVLPGELLPDHDDDGRLQQRRRRYCVARSGRKDDRRGADRGRNEVQCSDHTGAGDPLGGTKYCPAREQPVLMEAGGMNGDLIILWGCSRCGFRLLPDSSLYLSGWFRAARRCSGLLVTTRMSATMRRGTKWDVEMCVSQANTTMTCRGYGRPSATPNATRQTGQFMSRSSSSCADTLCEGG